MPPKLHSASDKSAGTAKERNEYIPSFIAKRPFYVVDDTSDADYLEHQRLQNSTAVADSASKWYDRGRKAGPAATKYRKGACENCGAMTHRTKECLGRPRKQGARWTGKDIAADEVVEDLQLGWAAKRDRWNGYGADDYRHVVDEFNDLQNLRNKPGGITAPQLENRGDTTVVDREDATAVSDSSTATDEGVKYEEETDMGRQQSTSTRNLRLREDTAKYLLNLDLDSAKYDPKTRSMVDGGVVADQAAALVAEEGFLRVSGEAAEFERAQRHAWDTERNGVGEKVHLQANPTAGEYLRRQFNHEEVAKVKAHKASLLERYGGLEYPHNGADATNEVIESNWYSEYDEDGLVKEKLRNKMTSSYVENMRIHNHTSTWGSWWKEFKWGYACCHSTMKNSYCVGKHEQFREGTFTPEDRSGDDE